MYSIDEETGLVLNKEEWIKKEEDRLNEIFKDIDKKKKKTVRSLISSAAFMAISIKELEGIINVKGYTEEYQNGANQKGIKKCSEVEIYNIMIKNHMNCIKQLTDLLPKTNNSVGSGNDGDDFDDFLQEKDR